MVQVPSGASPKNTLAPLLAAVAPPAMEVNRKVVIDAKSFLTVEMTLDLDRLAPLPAAVAPPAREVNRKVVIDAKSFLTVEMTLDLVRILGL